jgi:hypothetical protein
MTYVLAIIALTAYFFGLVLFFVAKSAMHEILGGVLCTVGTVALASIGIINAIDSVRTRLPEPPPSKNDTEVQT